MLDLAAFTRLADRKSGRKPGRRSCARVAERQTRWLQVPVSERAWGFKSPLAHAEEPREINDFPGFFLVFTDADGALAHAYLRNPSAVGPGPHSKGMAYLETRPRKSGATAYLVRWTDKSTGQSMSEKLYNLADARFLLTVLKAYESDTEAAHQNAATFYAET
jgi:hypothetical protein